MVVKTKNEDIFNTEAKHIAFAVNIEGINDSGFAGIVAAKGWNELADLGESLNGNNLELGTVISKKIGDKTFHALVSHSLKGSWGNNQADIIKQCFDSIASNGESIATIAIGTGLIGQMSGANFRQILVGMHESEKQIILYSQYTMQVVLDYIREENEKVEKSQIEETLNKRKRLGK